MMILFGHLCGQSPFADLFPINGAGAYSLDQMIFKEKQAGTGKSSG
ncbi:hypothetical protein B481_2729 [Planococcus halocryophilus Or1]|nr:hypothetical protein B481_2729 [Planococcus halocryophilus Or1]